MRAVHVKNENYDAKKLEAMYLNLLANVRNGQAQDYEIRADDFVVVARNNDPERFMSYADLISPETKYISVFLYRINSNASDKFFFHLQPNPYSQINGLGSISSNVNPMELEEKQKEKWRKELHYEQLMEENEELKEQLAEYERTIELLEEDKENIKGNRDLTLEHILGRFFTGAVKSDFVQENFPIVKDLGFVSKPQGNPNYEEEQATFKRKGDRPNVEVEDAEALVLSDEDKSYISIMRQVKERVNDIDYGNLLHLLDMLTINPQAIPFSIKQLSNYLKQKPTNKINNDEQI